MIDNEGCKLYSQMMNAIEYDENFVSEEVENAMAAFDTYMSRLNKTTRMLYSKNGEVLMEC